jgi:hypothetical protein
VLTQAKEPLKKALLALQLALEKGHLAPLKGAVVKGYPILTLTLRFSKGEEPLKAASRRASSYRAASGALLRGSAFAEHLRMR